MQTLHPKLVESSFTHLKINKGLRRRLTLAPLTRMNASEWLDLEMFALPTKDGAAGILYLKSQDVLYATTYEIRHIAAQATGRAKPIICDFCKTWQAGSRAGSITFRPKRHSLNSISLLCCLDLECSRHVRDQTAAAKMSRAQLREQLTPEQRVERLRTNLGQLIDRLQLSPLDT